MSYPSGKELEIQTPFYRIAAKQWGNPNGTPVIALHGWLDNANTFDRLAPLLPGLHLTCLDLPGHGRSDHRPPGMRYHMTDYVDDVMAVANKLKLEQFVLMGHSMGAGIACLTASAFPANIMRLVLIESLGAVTGGLNDAPASLRHSVLKMRTLSTKRRAGYKDFQKLIKARAAAGNINQDSAEILVRRAFKEEDNQIVWQSDKRLKVPTPNYLTDELMLAFLRAIEAPTFLVTAESGTLRKRHYFESRFKAIKNLQTINLPGNHHLHLDEPIPVARAIAEFLEGV